jgi:hypothetical protein
MPHIKGMLDDRSASLAQLFIQIAKNVSVLDPDPQGSASRIRNFECRIRFFQRSDPDPEPHQNDLDPQHWKMYYLNIQVHFMESHICSRVGQY